MMSSDEYISVPPAAAQGAGLTVEKTKTLSHLIFSSYHMELGTHSKWYLLKGEQSHEVSEGWRLGNSKREPDTDWSQGRWSSLRLGAGHIRGLQELVREGPRMGLEECRPFRDF